MSGGQPLSLAIILSPDFPKSRPNIFVEPRSVRHPWLREDGAVVGAPGKQTDSKKLNFLCFKEQHIENTLLFEFVTLLKVLVCEPCENATANFKTYHIFGQLKYTVIRRN
jgi:hypothetical protein